MDPSEPPRQPSAIGLRRPVEAMVLLLIVAGFTVCVTRAIAVQASFEFDEAVYAIQARAWAEATPATSVEPHRAPVLPALGTPVALFTDREDAYRVIGMMAGIAAVLAVWALGRAVSGPVTGLVAAAAFASARTVQYRSAQFLTDVLAVAFLVAVALVLWRSLAGRTEPARTLVLVAPLGALAFYTRYGSVVPLALMLGVAAVIWWPVLRARPRIAAQTVALGAVLALPNIIVSVIEFGTPWGIVTFSTRRAGYAYVGEGLWQYVRWFPNDLAGPITGILMLIAVAGVARAVATRAPDRAPLVFLGVSAGAHLVAIGLVSHGESRFAFFAIAMLCIAGGHVVAPLLRRPIVAGLAVVLAVATFGSSAAWTEDRTQDARAARTEVAIAGRALRRVALEPCVAFAFLDAPVGWYSRCAAHDFRTPPSSVPGRGRRYLVMFEHGGARAEGGLDPRARLQPAGAELRRLLDGARVVARVPDHGGRFGAATIYSLRIADARV